MAIVLKDRVKQAASAPGTGTITLGAVASGFQGFSAIGNGNVTYFAIVDSASGAWEVNYGTYTSSGTTLSRNATPLSSSAAGALVNFTGLVDVFCTYPSEKAIYEETSGNVLIDGGPLTVVGSGVTTYTTFSAALAELYANVIGYAQMYVQNLNTDVTSSTDIVAYNDAGDGTNNFIDMGIGSANYSDGAYPIFTQGSGYLYNNGGELIIGTSSVNKDVLLFAGGVATTNWAARISGTDQSITTKADLTVGGTLTGVGGSFTSPVTTSSSMVSPGSTELVTRSYVDTATSTAFAVHTSVRAATTGALATIYANGTAGVGATLTADTNRAWTTLDGVVGWSTTQRVLIKNQTNAFENGAYTITDLGVTGISPWVLTRATDFDTAAVGEIANNAYFYVNAGTVNAGSGYVLNQTAAITVGVTALPFDLFASSQVYTGGTNIDVSGTVISLTGTVAPTNGGTGVATVTTGDLLYGSATNTWSKLPIGSAYKSLVVNGAGTNVEWNAISLSSAGAVTGVLPESNGGTNQSIYTLGDTLYSNATNTLAKLAGNTTTTKKFMVQTGTGSVSAAPVWGTISGSDVSGNISGSAGSVANALTLGTYLTGTSFNGSTAVTATVDATSANTASKVVARDGSGNFSAGTITADLSGNAATATTSTNLAGGVANQIPYQTAAGTTAYITAASGTNYLLNYTGSAFSWVATSGLSVSSAATATALATPRAIYGNNFDGTAALNQIIASTYGGTGNGFTKFTGPTTSEKTFTLPDASSTIVVQGGALGTPSSGTLSGCTVDGTNGVGFLNIPQNAQTGSYTTVLGDSGKHLYHAVGAGAATYTIPANGTVAYPIGTAISFVNLSATAISIAITTDTMYLAGFGTTGTRTLAQYGTATALKLTSTVWIISGNGLT